MPSDSVNRSSTAWRSSPPGTASPSSTFCAATDVASAVNPLMLLRTWPSDRRGMKPLPWPRSRRPPGRASPGCTRHPRRAPWPRRTRSRHKRCAPQGCARQRLAPVKSPARYRPQATGRCPPRGCPQSRWSWRDSPRSGPRSRPPRPWSVAHGTQGQCILHLFLGGKGGGHAKCTAGQGDISDREGLRGGDYNAGCAG